MSSKKPGVVFTDEVHESSKQPHEDGKEGKKMSVTKGILKNAGTDTKSTKKTTSTSTSTNTTGFSDRIQGMGSTSHASTSTYSILAEKTMPPQERKSRIEQVRVIFPHFNTDYATDCLRAFEWDVSQAVDMIASDVLPQFLKNVDPGSYIHEPKNFLKAPNEIEFTDSDAKSTKDYNAALLSVKGKKLQYGPVQHPSMLKSIEAKEQEIRISRLRELFPQFSTGYSHDLLEHMRWDVDDAVNAHFGGDLPSYLLNVDPGSYVSRKRKEEKSNPKSEKKSDTKNAKTSPIASAKSPKENQKSSSSQPEGKSSRLHSEGKTKGDMPCERPAIIPPSSVPKDTTTTHATDANSTTASVGVQTKSFSTTGTQT
ncbi:hypothetical protein AAMO2058_001662300 [Amorphochlora amoebiformis]